MLISWTNCTAVATCTFRSGWGNGSMVDYHVNLYSKAEKTLVMQKKNIISYSKHGIHMFIEQDKHIKISVVDQPAKPHKPLLKLLIDIWPSVTQIIKDFHKPLLKLLLDIWPSVTQIIKDFHISLVQCNSVVTTNFPFLRKLRFKFWNRL